MLCAGAVRKTNLEDTLMKNLLDAMGAAIAFYATGYAFAFGSPNPEHTEPTFIGSGNFFLQDFEDYAIFFFQYGFAAATATIVAGALEERCRMVGYVLYSLFFVGFVYPVIAHNICKFRHC
jgi:Amt family ammonium transporter